MNYIRKILINLFRIFGKQNWIRVGIRERVIKMLYDPALALNYQYEIDFFGLKYAGNLNRLIDWYIYFFGAYEQQELFLLRDLANEKPESFFLDIGGNVGQHAIFMSKYCSVVHSFEPYDLVRNIFFEKIQINKIKNIVIHDLGLGNENAELDFFAPLGINIGSGSFLPDHEIQNNKSYGKLKVVNGDEFIKKLKLPRIDLIKIDVEGFEKNVLLGLKNTLKKYRPSVMMEYSSITKKSFGNLNNMLKTLPEDYEVLKISKDFNRFFFFNKPTYGLQKLKFEEPKCNILLKPLQK